MRALGSGEVKDDASGVAAPRRAFGPSLSSPDPKANSVHGLNGSDRRTTPYFPARSTGGRPPAERREERVVEGEWPTGQEDTSTCSEFRRSFGFRAATPW